MYIPGQICRKCRNEIGPEPWTFIQDKITRGLHKFHAACAPKDPDVRKHHGMLCEPGRFGMIGHSIGRVQ